MSTHITTIEGTYHSESNKDFSVKRSIAKLHLTRFFNGKELGPNIQLTVEQIGIGKDLLYIHLTKEQCEELGKVLLECFNYDKYPSE
jgi:hypothetical protein